VPWKQGERKFKDQILGFQTLNPHGIKKKIAPIVFPAGVLLFVSSGLLSSNQRGRGKLDSLNLLAYCGDTCRKDMDKNRSESNG